MRIVLNGTTKEEIIVQLNHCSLNWLVWSAVNLFVYYKKKKETDYLTRQDKTRQDKTRQDKTRQDKTRQDKTRQDKTR